MSSYDMVSVTGHKVSVHDDVREEQEIMSLPLWQRIYRGVLCGSWPPMWGKSPAMKVPDHGGRGGLELGGQREAAAGKHFRRHFIQLAAGDAGGALGCALLAHYQVEGHNRQADNQHDFIDGRQPVGPATPTRKLNCS
jgi:Predicted carbamoyl transferase, NodU family